MKKFATLLAVAAVATSAFAQSSESNSFVAKDNMLKTYSERLVERCAKDQFNTSEKAACIEIAVAKAIASCKSVAGSANSVERDACISVAREAGR